MKKFINILPMISFIVLASIILIACKEENNIEKVLHNEAETLKENETIVTEAPIKKTEPTGLPRFTEAPTPAPVKLDSNDPANWSDDMKEMRDISSNELVKELKIGWNLGNTMDATGNSTIMAETSWGNPKTTKEMIDTVKAAGFNVLRVPTTWEPHLGPDPDYTIDSEWLNRVQEIVNYGIANDMYVILNAHHEEWYFPSYENMDKAKDMMAKVWKQIADHFEAYDEHLIFEGMNEPRLKGTSDEWNGGNPEGWDVVNQLNAVFIETIRNAGGNNPLRHLMITPYAASSSVRAWSSFIVPEDDKVIVSIHAYTPYNFALNKNGTSEWDSSNPNDTQEIDYLMNSIYDNFIEKNIPVIIGEFGAMNKKDNTEARVNWTRYYVTKAKEKGIPCIWWDNGAFWGSGELFGLLDRLFIKWQTPEIIDAMMESVK